jgi:hypothetical protein
MICIYETKGKDTFPNADVSKDMIAAPTFNYEAKGVTSVTKFFKCARLFSCSLRVTTIGDIRSMMWG